MSYLQSVTEKRQDAREFNKKLELHNQLIDTTKNVGVVIGDTLVKQHAKDRINTQKTEVTNFPDLAQRADIKDVVQSIKSLGKDLSPKDIQPIIASLQDVVRAISNIPQPKPVQIPKAPDNIKVNNLAELKTYFDELNKSIQAISSNIKFDPKIVVKPTDVVVNERDIDFTKLIYAIKEKPSQKIDLDDFLASDLDENGSFQYVGLIAPSGHWYIIENDIDGNTLRYKFGDKNYKSHWRSRVSLNYKHLNEAINEI